MKEYVLVEFLVDWDDRNMLQECIKSLGDDFILIKSDIEWDTIDDVYAKTEKWYRLSGKIASVAATILKLQNPFIAERMRISYIPEDLKNKYRK